VSGIERYIYRSIDTHAILIGMETKPMAAARAAWREHYACLSACLAKPGWISEGFVQDRGPGAGGPCYQWTRKVKGKTVSVALSQEQYEWLAAAIANWRTVQATLKAMQQLSRSVLFTTIPGAPRRKRLGKKVLGIT
jgi:hypothetical protein